MKSSEFIDQLEDDAVTEAIRDAERRSSGEIRVFVTRRSVGKSGVMTAAARQFQALGMTATAERNGVLLFLAPRDQKFAILGDSAIDSRCGDRAWSRIATELHADLESGHFTTAVVAAIHRIGDLLATHFPRQADDPNELPDGIGRD